MATVPDGGLGRFHELCEADPDIRLVTLTTEEEGVALACGSWLGGELAVVAMQSGGTVRRGSCQAVPSTSEGS
ncbi:hypothetical protein [Candidatus Palauibacter sp.]|uniref:hypothetical protein n=1 Tax=Candidatus Palauibacter sp. TaxID=3101350 RepID=UPI003AF247E1